MQKSETINELAAALAIAQGQIKPALKDADNPFFKSKYADLASIWEAIREPLSKNGLSVPQFVENDGEFVTVTTMLCHKSGQWLSGSISLKPAKGDAQAAGSAATYGRRYGLSAIVGVVADVDDDGNAATFGGGKTRKTATAMKTDFAKIKNELLSADSLEALQNTWKFYNKEIAAMEEQFRIDLETAKETQKTTLQHKQQLGE